MDNSFTNLLNGGKSVPGLQLYTCSLCYKEFLYYHDFAIHERMHLEQLSLTSGLQGGVRYDNRPPLYNSTPTVSGTSLESFEFFRGYVAPPSHIQDHRGLLPVSTGAPEPDKGNTVYRTEADNRGVMSLDIRALPVESRGVTMYTRNVAMDTRPLSVDSRSMPVDIGGMQLPGDLGNKNPLNGLVRMGNPSLINRQQNNPADQGGAMSLPSMASSNQMTAGVQSKPGMGGNMQMYQNPQNSVGGMNPGMGGGLNSNAASGQNHGMNVNTTSLAGRNVIMTGSNMSTVQNISQGGGANQNMGGANPNMVEANPNMVGATPNMGANPIMIINDPNMVGPNTSVGGPIPNIGGGGQPGMAAGPGRPHPGMVPNQGQPGLPDALGGNQLLSNRNLIWKGQLEWEDKKARVPGPGPRIIRSLTCMVTIAVTDQEIVTANWPSTLIMQLMPQTLLNHNQLHPLFKNSREVAFHFHNTNLDHLKNLYKVFGNGLFAGWVHFPTNTACEIRVLLLLFSNRRRSFFGLIPKDQNGVVSGIRQVIIQHKQRANKPFSDIYQQTEQTNKNKSGVLPVEILRLDDKSIELYKKALADGEVAVHNIRVMVVGHFGVGKTALTRRMLKKSVDPGIRESTNGIQVYVRRCQVSLEDRKWTVLKKDAKSENTFKLLAKLMSQQTMSPNSKGQSTIDDPSSLGDVTDIDVGTSTLDDVTKEKHVDITTPKYVTDIDADNDNNSQEEAREKMDTIMEVIKDFMEYENNLNHDDLNNAEVSIWDFAGQSAFYGTHQVFLSPRAVYLLVTDISKHIQDVVEEDECYFDSTGSNYRTISEYVEFWLNSIHAYCASQQKGVPPVILVGTHADKLDQGNKTELSEQYFEALRNVVVDQVTHDHLVDENFAINNTIIDPKLTDLRDKIFKVASEQQHWGELIPARWITLEKAMIGLEEKGLKIYTKESLQNLNQTLPVPLTSDEELSLFLRFQHDTGTIIYFSDSGLCDHILLDPQWLVDAFKCLITAKMFLKNKPIYPEWREFNKSAILKHELIDAVWTRAEQPGFHEHRDQLIALMERLDMIVRPRSFVADGVQIKVEDFFLVPCMLKTLPDSSVLQPPTSGDATSTCTVCFTMTTGFMPVAVFNRILSSCVKRWPVSKSGQCQKYLIYCGVGVFDVDLQHRLTLFFSQNVIQLWIKKFSQNKSNQHPSKAVCTRVREFIVETFMKIKKQLRETCEFKVKLKCPDVDMRSNLGMFDLKDFLTEAGEVPCHYHDNWHVLISSEMLKYWGFEDSVSTEELSADMLKYWNLEEACGEDELSGGGLGETRKGGPDENTRCSRDDCSRENFHGNLDSGDRGEHQERLERAHRADRDIRSASPEGRRDIEDRDRECEERRRRSKSRDKDRRQSSRIKDRKKAKGEGGGLGETRKGGPDENTRCSRDDCSCENCHGSRDGGDRGEHPERLESAHRANRGIRSASPEGRSDIGDRDRECEERRRRSKSRDKDRRQSSRIKDRKKAKGEGDEEDKSESKKRPRRSRSRDRTHSKSHDRDRKHRRGRSRDRKCKDEDQNAQKEEDNMSTMQMPGRSSELKKTDNDALCQSAHDNLNTTMQSVGALVGPNSIGTVFVVGKKYVMTAWHVVRDIVKDSFGHVDYSKLEHSSTFINFNEDPKQQYVKYYIKQNIPFVDEGLDVVVLEIKNHNLPKPVRLCQQNVTCADLGCISLCGFGQNDSDKKHMEHGCQIIKPNSTRVNAAKDHLQAESNAGNTHSCYYKAAIAEIGKDARSVDLGYKGFEDESKWLFSCYMENGVSGSPLLAAVSGSVYTVGVMTNGIPIFYFDLPKLIQCQFPDKYRFEMGAKMSHVYRSMCQKNPTLAQKLF